MKRTYETPVVEKIAFQYQEQVVAASGNFSQLNNIGDDYCKEYVPDDPKVEL